MRVFKNHQNQRGPTRHMPLFPPGKSRPYSEIWAFLVEFTPTKTTGCNLRISSWKRRNIQKKNINSIGFHDVSFRGCIWIQTSSEPSDDDDGIKKLLALMSLVGLPNHDGSSIVQRNPSYSVVCLFFSSRLFLTLTLPKLNIAPEK